MMTGMARKVTAAKAEYAVHQQKVQVEQEEQARQKEIQKIESAAMQKAEQDAKQETKKDPTPAPILDDQLSDEAKRQQEERHLQLARQKRQEASDAKEKKATEQAEMVEATTAEVKAAEDARSREEGKAGDDLLLIQLVDTPKEEAEIVKQAKEGKHLKPSTKVCSLAKKGMIKLCALHG